VPPGVKVLPNAGSGTAATAAREVDQALVPAKAATREKAGSPEAHHGCYQLVHPWPSRGFIGSKIVNRTGEGLFLDIALGVVGAVVGGYLVIWTGTQSVTGLNLWSLLVAVIGAIVVLLVYRMVVSRT
jgi:uncharacterized membrane protein YeaQ/YmgE (transglycosylase-associated protein family)